MLDKEFKYYTTNQVALVKKYLGKYVVVKGTKVLGAYDSEAKAYLETTKKHAAGTFLIQFCAPGESAFSQSFHSRVVFF